MKTLDHHKKSRLAHSVYALLVSGVLCNSAFALQSLEDEHLEEVTGEGIAFVLDDFSMRWNGADTANSGEGTYSTGYARLIPVGPLSSLIQGHNDATYSAACATLPNSCTDSQKSRAKYDTNIGKGDVYLYGVAISANDGDANTQFSGNTVDVGTAENPWLFITKTDTIPNFSGDSKSLTSMNFEAPLLTNLVDSDGALLTTDPNSYDLKVALWADAFVRDPSKIEGDAAEFQLNGATRPLSPTDSTAVPRENRLRLQAVINGVSLNGTNVQVFQTLDGADVAAGLGNNTSSDYNHYNNTFGIGAMVRMNSGDSSTSALRVGAASDGTISTSSTGWNTWKTIHTGEYTGFDTTGNGGNVGTSCNNGGATNSAIVSTGGCQFQIQTRQRTDGKSQTRTWTLPSNLNAHAMRISTRETADSPNADNLLYSPATALTDIVSPKFADGEGLYLYNPNINLILGSRWQPLVFDSKDRNISLEITRIPNVAAVYKEIYTDYTGADASYKGGTCSIYWCGGDGNGISKNATHSSITIGSTNYTAPVNTGTNKTPLAITAYTGSDAIGVSFGALQSSQTADSSVVLNELQYKQRQLLTSTWTSAYWCSTQAIGCWGYSSGTGTLYQWQYKNASGTYVTGTTAVATPGNVNCSGNSCNSSSPAVTYDSYTYAACPTKANCTRYGTASNRSWTNGAWQSTANPTVDSFIGGVGAGYGQAGGVTYTTNQAPNPTFSSTPLNNLGSAVIDGLLIQHFKLTTKGL